MTVDAYVAIAECFEREGTSAVFGMMGTANQYWLNAMVARGIPFYSVRDEGPGLAMAEGFAHASGQIGVCTATSGPGVTQLATTMVVASRSRTPLVAFCGDEPSDSHAQSHTFDQERFAAAIESRFVRLNRADELHAAVREAFSIARFESRPVMLSVPLDVQLQQFDAASVYEPTTSLMEPVIEPRQDHIAAAADLIAASSRPVLLLGRGAVLSGCDKSATDLAQRIGALVATTMRAMNWPPKPDLFHAGISGGYSTSVAAELFESCDCLIAVGASLNHFTTASGRLFQDAARVQVDIRPASELVVDLKADCFIQSDAGAALQALETELDARSYTNPGYRTLEVEYLLHADKTPCLTEPLEPGTVDPREACRVVDRALPPEIGLVFSGSHAPNMAIKLSRAPRRLVVVNKEFGGMGKGLSAALGAAVGAGRPVAVVEGDAGFMLHAAEFETATRFGLPVLVIVMNDQALGSELHDPGVRDGKLDAGLARISTPDLGAVGRAMGGRGELIRDLAELEQSIAGFVHDPAPTLLDVRISSTVA